MDVLAPSVQEKTMFDIKPMLLTKKQASKFCNISTATFDKWVGCGLVPPPVSDSPKRWYIDALKNHFDKTSGIAPANDDEYDADLEKRIREWGDLA